MEFIAAVPARYASSRLPGKPLVQVGGMPMIKRVCLQCLKSGASRVIACVDDERVAAAVLGLPGVEICMTSHEARSGTERIAQMLTKLKIKSSSIIVNVQGDEPLINPEDIAAAAKLLQDSGADMSTLAAVIDKPSDVFDPNCVKVVMDKRGRALYFSRAPIPYERDNFAKTHQTLKFTHYHHIGIYGYRAKTILDYLKLEPAELERCESLEQLRLLHYGMSIAVGITKTPPEIGVDTKADLDRVNQIISEKNY